jgi:hypothetical protein
MEIQEQLHRVSIERAHEQLQLSDCVQILEIIVNNFTQKRMTPQTNKQTFFLVVFSKKLTCFLRM